MHSSVGPFGKSLLSLLDIMDCVQDDDTVNHWYTKWIYILIVQQIQMWNTRRRKTISNKWEYKNLVDIMDCEQWSKIWIYILQIQLDCTRSTNTYHRYIYIYICTYIQIFHFSVMGPRTFWFLNCIVVWKVKVDTFVFFCALWPFYAEAPAQKFLKNFLFQFCFFR